MPVMQEGAIRAARSHDQADDRARDHALRLGASSRRPELLFFFLLFTGGTIRFFSISAFVAVVAHR